MPRNLVLMLLPALSALSILVGCGSGDGLPRVAVSGTVKMGEDDLPAGSVSIVPNEEHKGPAANGTISDGMFSFSELDGPIAGPHVVTITFTPTKDELIRMRIDGREVQTSWEFPLTIPAEATFEHDFVLTQPTVTEAENESTGAQE